MSRRLRIPVAAAAIVLFLFTWNRLERAREPKYAGRTVSEWFKQYYQTSTQARYDQFDHEEAGEALKKLGTNALPFLLKKTFEVEPDSKSRKAFYSFLGGLPQSWHLPFYVSSDTIATEAAFGVCELKPPAEVLLPELEERLKSKSKYQRHQAIFLLGGLGAGAEKGFPILIQQIKPEDAWGQAMALQSLRNYGMKGKAVAPALTELLSQQVPGSSGYLDFARTLGTTRSNAVSALPLLEPVFQSRTNWETRCTLATVICKIDPGKTEALNFLLDSIKKDSNPKHRANAVQALIEVGTNAPAVIPALVQMFDDPQVDISSQGIYGLKILGAAKELYVPQLEKRLMSTNETTVVNIASQLLGADSRNRAALQVMMELIKKRSPFEGFAIQRLGEIGPAAREAAPLLKEVLTTHDEHVRETARKALKRILAPTDSLGDKR